MLHMYAKKLAHGSIILHCDNSTVVQVINAQSSKDGKIMKLLRHIVLLCLNHNIIFKAEHIQGKKNILADRISRGQIDPEFLQRHGMQPYPFPVPATLRPVNLSI